MFRFPSLTLQNPAIKGEEPLPPIHITNYAVELSFSTEPKSHQDEEIE